MTLLQCLNIALIARSCMGPVLIYVYQMHYKSARLYDSKQDEGVLKILRLIWPIYGLDAC